MNFMMHGGARQRKLYNFIAIFFPSHRLSLPLALMSHNMAGPAILRPPPMAQMPPWGGPVMMGRGSTFQRLPTLLRFNLGFLSHILICSASNGPCECRCPTYDDARRPRGS